MKKNDKKKRFPL